MSGYHYVVETIEEATPSTPWWVIRGREVLATFADRTAALALAMTRARTDVSVGLKAQVHERTRNGMVTVWVYGHDEPLHPRRPPAPLEHAGAAHASP